MPGSQGAAGERNNVWDLEKPRSPKSLGAMEWVNHPHARGIGGRGWGTPRCFGTPPSRATCPLPRGDQQTLQHSHSRAGDPRTSAPTPAPTRRGRPPGWAWGGGCGRGRGRSRLTRSCRRRRRRRRRRRSPARRPRCQLGSSPRPCRRSAAPPPAPPPSSPRNLRLQSPNSAAAARKKGDFPRPRRLRRSALPQTWMQRSEIMTLCSPRIQGSWTSAPPLSEKSGAPVISFPRTQGTELPTPSILRSRNPPLLLPPPLGTQESRLPSPLLRRTQDFQSSQPRNSEGWWWAGGGRASESAVLSLSPMWR